mmetsp:Transcript_41471/g.64743  ORF Transcript_41471/g.64743 Transcript_41471/m.64743 type:complete len:426 (-) Transcript_41471:900-2177(-)
MLRARQGGMRLGKRGLLGSSSWRAISTGSFSPDRHPVIVSAVRTPIGSFGGSLSSYSAPKLGSIAIKGALERADLPPEVVQEVYMGNVVSAGVGQAPARQAALAAGIPNSAIATTVNKVCASGMKSITLAAQNILLNGSDVHIAGGMESMTNAPFLLEKARFSGYRYNHGKLVDSLVHDGLWDPYGDHHMGICAEKCAKDYDISRDEMDTHAEETYKRTIQSLNTGLYDAEIVPVIQATKKGEVVVREDEEPRKVKLEKIRALKPAFVPDGGKVTAANASSINDGATALVVMSAGRAKELGLKPLAKILAFADAEQAPIDFTTTPALALKKAMKYIGAEKGNIDLWEINQAFSVVSIANQRLLDIDPEKLDITGGAVVLGHPIGSSGARVVTTLLHSLIRTDKTLGAAGICNGGGGGTAIIIERI